MLGGNPLPSYLAGFTNEMVSKPLINVAQPVPDGLVREFDEWESGLTTKLPEQPRCHFEVAADGCLIQYVASRLDLSRTDFM